MSSRAPAGLPPAVAQYQSSWGRAAGVSLALVVVCGLHIAVRGLAGADLAGASTGLTLLVGLTALFLLLKERRHVMAAGPGWLSSREYVRRRWTRTDRLVRLSRSLCGIEQVLTFVDDEDRRVGLTATDLREDIALFVQVRADVRRSLAGGLQADERALAVLFPEGTPPEGTPPAPD